jgi:cell wall-associated NlpC family hydrolase
MAWDIGLWSGENRTDKEGGLIDPSLGFSLREKMDALPIDWRNSYLGFDARGKPCGWPGSAAELAGVPTISVSAELVIETPLEALRESPSHRAGLLSEARMGELFQLIQERGEWSLVAGEDGYVAWMRSWSSRQVSQREKEELLSRRIGLFEPVLGTFDARDGMCPALLRGTPLLRVEDTRLDSSPISVGLVDGTRGGLPLQAVRSSPPKAEVSALVGEASRYLGAPYRWGGRSPLGLDCSGYTQLVARSCGFFLPRDALQQASCGSAVTSDPATWQPGDLLFFHEPVDHVAFWAGTGTLLHARSRVCRQKSAELAELMDSLVAVRRLGAADRLSHESLCVWIG